MSDENQSTGNGNGTEIATATIESGKADSITAIGLPPAPETVAPPVPGNGLNVPPAEPVSILPLSDAPRETTERNLAWYQKNCDWTKSNSQLAQICGVTRQRISAVRAQLFPDPADRPPVGRPPKVAPVATTATGPAPGAEPEIKPDFSDVEQPPAQPAPAPVIVIDHAKTAEMAFDVSIGLLVKIFGDEWQASSADERQAMIFSIKNYMDSINMPELSPGWTLVLVSAMYAGARFAQPKTRGKLSLMWAWVKSKWPKRKKSVALSIVNKG